MGYKNHIVGKWHLGHFREVYTPLRRSFDSHYGYWTGHQDYYDHTAVDGVIHKSAIILTWCALIWVYYYHYRMLGDMT